MAKPESSYKERRNNSIERSKKREFEGRGTGIGRQGEVRGALMICARQAEGREIGGKRGSKGRERERLNYAFT